MKIPRLVLLSLVCALSPLSAQSESNPYTAAQRAYLAGDITTAKQKFEDVLVTDPTHAGAKNYLKAIETAEKKAPKQDLARQLQQLILPKITLKEATFESTLDYLKSKAAEVSQGKVTPSFVVQTGPDFNRQQPVTLELANVPFTEALRYLGELTHTKFQIQQYAILVGSK